MKEEENESPVLQHGVTTVHQKTPTAAHYRGRKASQRAPDFRDGYRQRQEETTEYGSSPMCPLILLW